MGQFLREIADDQRLEMAAVKINASLTEENKAGSALGCSQGGGCSGFSMA